MTPRVIGSVSKRKQFIVSEMFSLGRKLYEPCILFQRSSPDLMEL